MAKSDRQSLLEREYIFQLQNKKKPKKIDHGHGQIIYVYVRDNDPFLFWPVPYVAGDNNYLFNPKNTFRLCY